ncbi:MAG TPA: GNAT family N-acetyltransferase, partial [Propionibacteriaceae bacterium]|nr:GNAT family N-acetyltransferase [Propionibacteriaceae bacterium]
MIIRRARLADVESAAACHLACWQEAYAGIVEPERLAGIVAKLPARVELWLRLVNSGTPPLVAIDFDKIVGFAGAGPAHEDGVEADYQLHAINVRQAYWGTGIGQELIDRAIGDRSCFLWVARDNPRAIAFYRRNRFKPDGA